MAVFLWRLVPVLTCGSALALTGLFLKTWTFGFNSDYVVAGLLAKRTLETGQWFIFVPGIGYQGMLLEGGLIALSFKFLGMNPYALNLPATLLFLAVLGVFGWIVALSHGARVGWLATLFLSVSSPNLYVTLLRPAPNYTETFLIGLLMTALYLRLVERWYVRRCSLDRLDWLLVSLFGVLFGFGLYNYAQILFFAGAIGLHALLLSLRYAESLPRGHVASLLGGLGGLAGVCWRHRVPLLVAFAGFLAGYSPKLYYNFVLGEPSVLRTGLSVSPDRILNRLGYLIEGHTLYLNLFDTGWFKGALAIGFLALMAFSLVWFARRCVSFARGELPEACALYLSPLFFLALVVPAAFLVSASVGDMGAVRYSLALFLFYALALAIAVDRLTRRSALLQVSVLGFVGLFLYNNAMGFEREIRNAPVEAESEAVVRYLDQQNIRRGYADYWQAYTVNFLTQERIVLEPTYGNFLPFYAPVVETESRLAYVDVEESRFPVVNGRVRLSGRDFIVESLEEIGLVDVYILTADKR